MTGEVIRMQYTTLVKELARLRARRLVIATLATSPRAAMPLPA